MRQAASKTVVIYCANIVVVAAISTETENLILLPDQQYHHTHGFLTLSKAVICQRRRLEKADIIKCFNVLYFFPNALPRGTIFVKEQQDKSFPLNAQLF